MTVSAVLLAAGRGARMGAATNKVFLRVGGRPVLAHAVDAFRACSSVNEIIVVVRPGEEPEVRTLIGEHGTEILVIPGGAQRRDSALAGVRCATGEIVLIHDAARPFVRTELIDRVVAGARRFGAAVPVIPEVDTLRRTRDGELDRETIERTDLMRMQTPQGFHTVEIRRRLETAMRSIPDDAAALLLAGLPVHAVPGDPLNIKVTRPEDLTLGEAILSIR
jgi:2-C-methyl-D-erythritol 4-phosphate cytidylyltransferase